MLAEEVSDTIVAQATPAGRSGIGVVRLSGPRSLDLIRSLIADPQWSPQPGKAHLVTLRAPAGDQIIDQPLVTYFRKPHSYTGEDVVEISCHGSPVVLNKLLEVLLSLDARTADAGEFTLRALANGKINLSQAEAIRDLIDAQTDAAASQAVKQLGGELSNRLRPIKDELIKIIVPLESSLEFVEDDLPIDLARGIGERLRSLSSNLNKLSLTFRAGKLLRDGLKVVLLGRPNVGKSSIFNGLLSEDRAIVTPLPGTTRDTLSELISLNGVPVLLTDTAGVHESIDPIERLGIERTRRAVAEADLVVIVLDGTRELNAEDHAVIRDAVGKNLVVVRNKCDLPDFMPHAGQYQNSSGSVIVSAQSGVGFDDLRKAILEPFASSNGNRSDFLITNARHYDLLRRSVASLDSARDLLDQRASEELILVGLYEALNCLGEVTGETTPEHILTQIFSTFCIGK